MMSSDLFQPRKGIHVKIDTETHRALRSKLFLHGLTMQEFFEEFAKAFVAGDTRAVKVIDNMVLRRVQFHLTEGVKQPKRTQETSELDANTLYDLINSPDGVTATSGSGGDDEAV